MSVYIFHNFVLPSLNFTAQPENVKSKTNKQKCSTGKDDLEKDQGKKGRTGLGLILTDAPLETLQKKLGQPNIQITQPEFDLHKNASIVFFETVGLKNNIIKAQIKMYI